MPREAASCAPPEGLGGERARRRSLPLRRLRAAAHGPSPPVLLGVAHKGRN